MNITAKNFDLTDAIHDYIEKKVSAALASLNGDVIHNDIEVDRTTKHHTKGDVFHVRIHVQIPHGELYAEETAEDLYAAIDIASGEILRQVTDVKTKRQSLQRKARRTSRSLKSILTFWKNDSL